MVSESRTNLFAFLSAEKIAECVDNTKKDGIILIGLLGTSAWLAPGASGSWVAEAILCDQKKIIPSYIAL